MKNSNHVFHDFYFNTKKLDNHSVKFLHAIFQTGTWQGAALKGIGYGIKGGITYGLTCRY